MLDFKRLNFRQYLKKFLFALILLIGAGCFLCFFRFQNYSFATGNSIHEFSLIYEYSLRKRIFSMFEQSHPRNVNESDLDYRKRYVNWLDGCIRLQQNQTDLSNILSTVQQTFIDESLLDEPYMGNERNREDEEIAGNFRYVNWLLYGAHSLDRLERFLSDSISSNDEKKLLAEEWLLINACCCNMVKNFVSSNNDLLSSFDNFRRFRRIVEQGVDFSSLSDICSDDIINCYREAAGELSNQSV